MLAIICLIRNFYLRAVLLTLAFPFSLLASLVTYSLPAKWGGHPDPKFIVSKRFWAHMADIYVAAVHGSLTPPFTCGRCYEDTDRLYRSGCDEKPERLDDMPLGQYHCPDCSAMVIAGVPHPRVCAPCRDRKHPDLDVRGVEAWLE